MFTGTALYNEAIRAPCFAYPSEAERQEDRDARAGQRARSQALLADADAEAHIQSGAIDEADQFPEVIMAATSGKLAYAESCRDYWRMEDDREWGTTKPKLVHRPTVGGNVLKEMATVGRSTTLDKLPENRVTFDEAAIKEPAPDGPASPLTP